MISAIGEGSSGGSEVKDSVGLEVTVAFFGDGPLRWVPGLKSWARQPAHNDRAEDKMSVCVCVCVFVCVCVLPTQPSSCLRCSG